MRKHAVDDILRIAPDGMKWQWRIVDGQHHTAAWLTVPRGDDPYTWRDEAEKLARTMPGAER